MLKVPKLLDPVLVVLLEGDGNLRKCGIVEVFEAIKEDDGPLVPSAKRSALWSHHTCCHDVYLVTGKTKANQL